jgi:hypothetical protein
MIALTAVIAKRKREARRLETAIMYMLSEAEAKWRRIQRKWRKRGDDGDPRAEV